MTLGVNVHGGTRAGWRSPFQSGAPMPWQCRCSEIVPVPNGDNVVRKTNPGHLARCPRCGARRPS